MARFSLAERKRLDHFSAHFGYLTLQRTHTRLPGVVANDIETGLLGDLDLTGFQTIQFGLLGNQVALRDVELFVLGVTRYPNHFHAIKQRSRDVHRI